MKRIVVMSLLVMSMLFNSFIPLANDEVSVCAYEYIEEFLY